MAQSKQTSFGNGEVSPEIHFLSSSVTYSNSLSKLNNGYVRHMGGVSNRQGSEFLFWNPYSPKYDVKAITVPGGNFFNPNDPNSKIPEAGGDEQIVGYGYWNSVHEIWDTLEIGYFLDIDQGDPALSLMRKGYRVNYGNVEFFHDGGLNLPPCEIAEPKDIRFVTIKDSVLITPNAVCTNTGSPLVFPAQPASWTSYENLRLDMTSRKIQTALQNTARGSFNVSLITPKHHTLAQGPFFPVTYLFTATTRNDEEVIIGNFPTQGYDPATWNPYVAPATPPEVLYPHTDSMVDLVLLIFTYGGSLSQLIKSLTLYRATGAAGIKGSMFRKVGSIIPSDGNIILNDQGQTTSEITPPIDYSFMSLTNPGAYTDIKYYSPQYAVAQASAATYYQQRLITAYKSNKSSETPATDFKFETSAGDMVASKLGAPYQLAKPLIVTETEAFQFAPPVADGSEVVGFLSMERLIALTEKAAYGYMGGENGVFSPFTLNPVKISDTGCSRQVNPVTANGRGYYVSADHTKIMGVLMNVDGQIKVFEASKNASHLLESGIRKMELLSGKDDLLVVLRRDGVIITIAVNIEGSDNDDDKIGFSTFEIDNGFVESMYVTKMKKNYIHNQNNTELINLPHDVIVMYTVRNGIRRLEVLRPREDAQPEAFVYSDLSVPFGYRLADNGFAGYKKIYWQPSSYLPLAYTVEDFHINLGDGTTTGWTPEDQIPLYSKESLTFYHDIKKIIFYYGDDKHPKKFTYTITPGSEEATGLTDFPFKYSGYVNADVPEAYRDVENSSMTTAEKNEYWTRWCPAITEIKSPELYLLKNAVDASKFPDGKVPVSVYADAQILSSPNNPHKQNIVAYLEDVGMDTVVKIPEGFDCGWGNIGLPYEFTMASMRLEASDDATTLQSAHKLINAVGVGLKDSQGGFIGIPEFTLEDCQEMLTSPGPDFTELPKPVSGYYEWTIPTNFNDHGKVSIRHVDPTPLTVLALYPSGVASGG